MYTPFAYLMTSDDRVHYDDNYVTLYPNEPKTLRVENCTETPVLHVGRTRPERRNEKSQLYGFLVLIRTEMLPHRAPLCAACFL